jgi:hypothetical protein
MQVLKIALKVLLVVPTCQPIQSSRSILLEFRQCLCEVINTDVMEERGELLLLARISHAVWSRAAAD